MRGREGRRREEGERGGVGMNGGEEEGKRERASEREGKVWKGTKRGEKRKNGLGLVRGAGTASQRLSGEGPA